MTDTQLVKTIEESIQLFSTANLNEEIRKAVKPFLDLEMMNVETGSSVAYVTVMEPVIVQKDLTLTSLIEYFANDKIIPIPNYIDSILTNIINKILEQKGTIRVEGLEDLPELENIPEYKDVVLFFKMNMILSLRSIVDVDDVNTADGLQVQGKHIVYIPWRYEVHLSDQPSEETSLYYLTYNGEFKQHIVE